MIVGVLGFSTFICMVVLFNWLSKFNLEDDFNERER